VSSNILLRTVFLQVPTIPNLVGGVGVVGVVRVVGVLEFWTWYRWWLQLMCYALSRLPSS
jgi:hypothetical protein